MIHIAQALNAITKETDNIAQALNITKEMIHIADLMINTQ